MAGDVAWMRTFRWPSLEDRFWPKVVKSDDCWPWQGRLNADGYGWLGKRSAHSIAYEIANGPVPDGLELDHRCHSQDPSCPGGPGCQHRRCVNPDHLEPVTRAENNRRRLAAQTSCRNGHEYTPENTRMRNGKRTCLRCRAEWLRQRKQQKKAAA